MDKYLNKWICKLRRWMVFPFIALLLTVLFTRGSTIGDTAQRIQAALMIVMAITGAYLYPLPYWSKWQRQRSGN